MWPKSYGWLACKFEIKKWQCYLIVCFNCGCRFYYMDEVPKCPNERIWSTLWTLGKGKKIKTSLIAFVDLNPPPTKYLWWHLKITYKCDILLTWWVNSRKFHLGPIIQETIFNTFIYMIWMKNEIPLNEFHPWMTN